MALRTPMSRTRPARSAELVDLPVARPNSFTSSAPDTSKRSVIWVFIEALRSMPSRVMPAGGGPTRLAGMMNTGSTTSARSVSRHSRRSMAASVVASTITFDTTVPSVPVTRPLGADHVVVHAG